MNNESRTTTSSIQKLVYQNIIEKAKDVRNHHVCRLPAEFLTLGSNVGFFD